MLMLLGDDQVHMIMGDQIRRSSCRCCSGAPEEPGESKCERRNGTTATISSEFVCKPHWLAFSCLLTLLPLFTHWWLLPSIHTTPACLPPRDKPSVIMFPHLLPQHHTISLKMLPEQRMFETSLPPHWPVKQNNNLYQQL